MKGCLKEKKERKPLVIQQFLSSRKNPYLGVILPVVYIGSVVFYFNKLMADGDHFSTWLMIVAALCGLLSIGISGRGSFHISLFVY
ncbi:hypothetical protein [Priestia filamentosa]|uniref:hypothetical protein n=1 Tax=Priestia filamentosa TaxID=1402861 RepID=UPI0009D92F1E|nr:hypothetical protein [Priestia filamentosa]